MADKLATVSSERIDSASLEHWLHCYEQMSRIRQIDERVNELYQKALMPGLAHLYIARRQSR